VVVCGKTANEALPDAIMTATENNEAALRPAKSITLFQEHGAIYLVPCFFMRVGKS
jgi:hypothetical protein